MLKTMIDLHTHSSASDGQYSPADLVQKAFDRNIKVLALTDHDTTSGLQEAKQKANELGMIFVPGIEISIDRPKSEFHLLGLGLKTESESLKKIIKNAKENRENRNILMVEKLNEHGISVTLQEIKNEFPRSSLGRPQFAEFLKNHGFVKNIQSAFDKFLSRGKPCFIEKTGIPLDDAISAIYESGGVPVLAHPLSLYLSWSHLEETVKTFREKGILGLEAYHPGARVVECEKLEFMARRLDLFVTAGSDFHGEAIRRDRRIGITCGERKIDDRFYFNELLKALENLK